MAGSVYTELVSPSFFINRIKCTWQKFVQPVLTAFAE